MTGVYQKGAKHNPANYRPVSLTSISCKVLEHIVHSSISTHLQAHNILTPHQHGFRKSHSCDTQLTLTVNDLATTLDKRPGTIIDMAILDFSKAFDTVPHERLLSKCHSAGIRGNTLSWIRSFLTDRRQRVLVSGSGSSWRPVTSGVPQGTVLGPLLFLLYINDITDDLTDGTTARLFADDCIIYRTIFQEQDRTILQRDLTQLHTWSQKWQMHFNPKKCTTMHISTRGNSPPYKYHLAGEQLETVREHKYLGITIADNLNWNAHIDNSCRKASQIFSLLRRNLKGCSIHTKATAFQSLVRPYLEYAVPAWDPHTKTNIDKLEKVQRRAARFTLNNYSYPPAPNSSVTTMLANLGWQPLHTRRTVTRLTFLYKIVHQTIAIPNHLTPAYRNTRANHPYKFLHMQCRINQFKYSFFPRTLIEWNRLPSAIVLLPSSESFKTGVASHYLGAPGFSYTCPAPNN
jgi:ribonuclease P/MRP protein subunit RPP40